MHTSTKAFVVFIFAAGIALPRLTTALSPPRHFEIPANPPASRTIKLDRHLKDDPVDVVAIFEGDENVMPLSVGRDPSTGQPNRRSTGRTFEAGDKWIDNLVVVLKNYSDKNIVAGSFRLDLPESGTGTLESPITSASTQFGTNPTHPGGAPIRWNSGSEFRISISDYADNVKAAVNYVEGGDPTVVWLRLQFFYFDDGTRWAPGDFQRWDTSLQAWVRISAEDFRAGKTPE